MNDVQNETTLAQARLHWAIFILPLLATGMLLLVALPFLFLIHVFSNMVSQINPQHVTPVGGFLSVFPFLPVVIVGLPLLVITWVAYLKSEITLTNRRLIFRAGFLMRIAGEIPLENVEAIIIVEPLMGRVFGYGTVIVTSVGGLRFPLRYIGEAQNFHAKLQQAVKDAKRPAQAGKKVSVSRPDDDSRYLPKG
jgi:uncharacterized membrane protein YdbT with pleckstrin-like domain